VKGTQRIKVKKDKRTKMASGLVNKMRRHKIDTANKDAALLLSMYISTQTRSIKTKSKYRDPPIPERLQYTTGGKKAETRTGANRVEYLKQIKPLISTWRRLKPKLTKGPQKEAVLPNNETKTESNTVKARVLDCSTLTPL